ncbi:hypothetical protein GOBAR_DD15171 [Gossypium barbadense]|nr:hypothetical protein GOBAR_DD15171 [Gossypium barbadense]
MGDQSNNARWKTNQEMRGGEPSTGVSQVASHGVTCLGGAGVYPVESARWKANWTMRGEGSSVIISWVASRCATYLGGARV